MFSKAQRKRSKLRLGLSGPSGSGKTWSALEIATGMGGKIALIDTEAGRAELYGDDFEYDAMQLGVPYSPDKYIKAIKDAEKLGYTTLIIDSLSHAWVGEGGVLSIVEQAGGSFQKGWKKGTPAQNSLVDAIVTSKLHIIATLRSKTKYVTEQNDNGKSAPRKIGLEPIQREGLEFEFTLFAEMDMDHIAHFTKDNTKLFDQQFIKPTIEMGVKLMEWLNSGVDAQLEFAIKILPEIIKTIGSCKDKVELQSVFEKSKLQYAEKFPQEFVEIIDAKDKKKLELGIV